MAKSKLKQQEFFDRFYYDQGGYAALEHIMKNEPPVKQAIKAALHFGRSEVQGRRWVEDYNQEHTS